MSVSDAIRKMIDYGTSQTLAVKCIKPVCQQQLDMELKVEYPSFEILKPPISETSARRHEHNAVQM
jgi:hypothetical protein